jgi:hypothetical protein
MCGQDARRLIAELVVENSLLREALALGVMPGDDLRAVRLEPAVDLAQRFRFYQAGHKEAMDSLIAAFEEHLRLDFEFRTMAEEIDRKGRNRTERSWHFFSRVSPQQSQLSGSEAFLRASHERSGIHNRLFDATGSGLRPNG